MVTPATTPAVVRRVKRRAKSALSTSLPTLGAMWLCAWPTWDGPTRASRFRRTRTTQWRPDSSKLCWRRGWFKNDRPPTTTGVVALIKESALSPKWVHQDPVCHGLYSKMKSPLPLSKVVPSPQVITIDLRSTQFGGGLGITLPESVDAGIKNKASASELPYVKMLNRVLPQDIRILDWAPVAEGFSARFDCQSRTYRYYFPRGSLDVALMADAAKRWVKTQHDKCHWYWCHPLMSQFWFDVLFYLHQIRGHSRLSQHL